MAAMSDASKSPAFAALTPDVVLDLTERALGIRCANLCRPLNSYINRVYEVQRDDGGWVIAKFYRPGRWSDDALQDELDFLRELEAREIPVVPPLPGAGGALLHREGAMRFAVFPRKGGRPLVEPDTGQWRELGRLLGRLHVVGAEHAPRDRLRLHPAHSTRRHLEDILACAWPSAGLRAEYAGLVGQLIERIAPLFEDQPALRLHGDCHAQNILHRPGEPFHLIDFDDMAVGPAVQDLWMLLPGHVRETRRELDLLLDGYLLFRDLEPGALRLIEPLRAMRFIHYTAWCARQKTDGGFARLAPDWGTEAHWRRELDDLRRQLREIEDALA